MKVVEITWLDAACESAQLDLEHAKNVKPMLRHNVGYLLSKNKDGVRICFGDIGEGHHQVYENTLVVPLKDVQKIREL